MADEFKPIKTQEEFNERIQSRINRLNKKYEGYVSPEDVEKIKLEYQSQIDELNAKISEGGEDSSKLNDVMAQNEELSKKVSAYELNELKTRIAIEEGIPYDFISRINGTDEKEIRADAQKVARVINNQINQVKQPVAPMASYDPSMTDEQLKEAQLHNAYRRLIK